MAFTLPTLPYPADALAPTISAETIGLHHGKHHATYVTKLNGLVAGTEFAGMTLEQVVRKDPKGPIFNNAAQHWNHSFYWRSMSPTGGGKPTGAVAAAMKASHGSVAACIKAMKEAATGHFGSGWVWLVADATGAISVTEGHDADNPLKHRATALLTIDVWEHAYYVDHRNVRADYVSGFFERLVNWDFAAENLAAITR
jgi:Fe-Mn family superoxide dismutase